MRNGEKSPRMRDDIGWMERGLPLRGRWPSDSEVGGSFVKRAVEDARPYGITAGDENGTGNPSPTV